MTRSFPQGAEPADKSGDEQISVLRLAEATAAFLAFRVLEIEQILAILALKQSHRAILVPFNWSLRSSKNNSSK